MNNTHDWFDVIYSNPDKGLSDFANAGLSEKNIDLKNRDYYKIFLKSKLLLQTLRLKSLTLQRTISTMIL